MTNQHMNPPEMNIADLYREEVFTDRKIGSIIRMTPVTPEGNADSTRPVLFSGQTQTLTPMGPMPINFELPAQSLQEAVQMFTATARVAVENTMREMQRMQTGAASSFILPGEGGPQGGGKIKLS